MKFSICLILLLPAALHAAPAASDSKATVAVFEFKSDWNVDYRVQVTDAGKTFSAWLAHDLEDLSPITVVDSGGVEKSSRGQDLALGNAITPAVARQMGEKLGAASLVSGSIFKSGEGVIVAAKIVSAETGEALGTSVEGGPTTPLASVISQLSQQVGEIVLMQQGRRKADWQPATIVGTRDLVATIIPNVPRLDLTGVISIDGASVSQGRESWKQQLPLRPGAHQLGIYYYEGQPITSKYLTFDAMPGASYVVVYDHDAPENNRLWIEDRITHQRVSMLDRSSWASKSRDNEFPLFFDMPGVFLGSSGSFPNMNQSPSSAAPASLSGHK
jgi:TolB-like protein